MSDDDDDGNALLRAMNGQLAILLMPKYAERFGLIRYFQLKRAGVHHCNIDEAFRSGWMKRVAHGVYTAKGVQRAALTPYAILGVALADPIAALVTAAMYCGLLPFKHHVPWFGIRRGARPPKSNFRAHWLRWSDARHKEGITATTLGGVAVLMTSPARTVADYFAHQRRLPAGAALRMLARYRASEFFDERLLVEYAALCRVRSLVKTALRYQ